MLLNVARTTQRLASTASALALSAATAVALPATAHADGATLTTADGRVLSVGFVVTTGERVGDVCRFASVPSLGLTTDDAAVTVTADEACRLAVSKIAVGVGQPAPVSPYARPKWNEDADAALTSVEPAGGGGIDVDLAEAGTAVDAALDAVTDAAKQRWTQQVHAVYVAQTVYDSAGLRQYQDEMYAEYIEEWNATEGRVRGMTPSEGACTGGTLGDVIGDDPLLEIRNCYYRTTANGYDRVGFETGGYYKQGWRVGTTGVVIDERQMREVFTASYGESSAWDCVVGDSLPVGWSSECWGRDV